MTSARKAATSLSTPRRQEALGGRGAARGKVDIVLPKRSNLPPLVWAAFAHHRPLIESGCDIYLAPPCFDHTKLMTVDGGRTMCGRATGTRAACGSISGTP